MSGLADKGLACARPDSQGFTDSDINLPSPGQSQSLFCVADGEQLASAYQFDLGIV